MCLNSCKARMGSAGTHPYFYLFSHHYQLLLTHYHEKFNIFPQLFLREAKYHQNNIPWFECSNSHASVAFMHSCNKSNLNVTITLGLQIFTWLTSISLVSKKDTPITPPPKTVIPYRVKCMAPMSLWTSLHVFLHNKWNLTLNLDFKIISTSLKIREILSADYVRLEEFKCLAGSSQVHWQPATAIWVCWVWRNDPCPQKYNTTTLSSCCGWRRWACYVSLHWLRKSYHWSARANVIVLWKNSQSSTMKIATYIDYGFAYLSVHINRINIQQKKELKILCYHHFKNYKLKNYKDSIIQFPTKQNKLLLFPCHTFLCMAALLHTTSSSKLHHPMSLKVLYFNSILTSTFAPSVFKLFRIWKPGLIGEVVAEIPLTLPCWLASGLKTAPVLRVSSEVIIHLWWTSPLPCLQELFVTDINSNLSSFTTLG